MRVTENMRVSAAMMQTTQASGRVLSTSRVASSGLRVELPADDPVAWTSITGRDGRMSLMKARASTLDSASSDLDLAEGALASATDVMVRARELTVQMSNGAVDAKTRAAAATEVLGLRSQLIALANTKGTSGYVFGGTRTDTPPIDATGTFVGNASTTTAEIADGVTATSNASGARAFTVAGGRDVLADLSALATALTANDLPTITSSIDSMDADHRQIVGARTDTGMAAERLRSASTVIGTSLLSLQSAQAKDQEADAPTAYSDLTRAKDAYERAVAVTKEILSLSSISR